MRNLSSDNVARVLIHGTWTTPDRGSFEVVAGVRLFGATEPMFSYTIKGKTVMGRLSAVAAVELSSEPAEEPRREFAPPVDAAPWPDPNFPGRPPGLDHMGRHHGADTPAVHNHFRSTIVSPTRSSPGPDPGAGEEEESATA